MDRESRIREALRRLIGLYEKRPQKALSSIAAAAVIEDGVKVTFTEGGQKAVMDFPEPMGGEGAGPTPGFFARGGVTGCVAIGIKQAAILKGLTFHKVVVNIETDFDDSAVYGMGDASAGPLETRFAIHIDTPEPQATVAALVEDVLNRDSWFLALRDAQQVQTQVKVSI